MDRPSPGGPSSSPDGGHAALAERFRSGDRDAFAELYTAYLPAIYDFLTRLVHDPVAAEDLTQATFLQAFERREALRAPDRIRSWLFAIAHHLGINHVTRRRTEPMDQGLDVASSGGGPEAEAEATEAGALVWEAAAALEPRQYAVLDLSVRRGLSTAEVGEAISLSVSHAAVLVHRAHDALGNAVRDLLVARRRNACPALAALLAGKGPAFTADVRATVDHHLRRCPGCRQLGQQLTSPADLLGGLAPIVPPAWMLDEGAGRVLGQADFRRPHRLPRPPRRLAFVVASGAAIAGLAVGIVLASNSPGRSGSSPPPTAVSVTAPAGTPPAAVVLPTSTRAGVKRPVPRRRTARPRPTWTSRPKPTSRPTVTPTPRPRPTKVPPATETPRPTATPSPTPSPTQTPEPTFPPPPPTASQSPTPTPEATRTPRPSPTPPTCKICPL